MSVSDQIDDYLRAQLGKIRMGQQITMFNGQVYTFRTDAGQLVDKHLEYTEHPDDMPSIVFYTGKNVSSLDGDPAPELGRENHLLEISIEGFIESDKAGTEGDDLKLDISVALKADLYWGGLIELLQGFETDSDIQVGDIIFTIIKVGFTALYTAPFGSE